MFIDLSYNSPQFAFVVGVGGIACLCDEVGKGERVFTVEECLAVARVAGEQSGVVQEALGGGVVAAKPVLDHV